MLTNLTIKNFKAFDSVEIELGDRVVFIGPNNSGKTSALQALALWDAGVKKWIEKRGKGEVPKKRPGVTINRKDLITLPVPEASLLWRNLHVRDSVEKGTQNVRLEITCEGTSEGEVWKCGVEFDFANEESFYCRPLRLSESSDLARMAVPEQVSALKVAFLPPMSGLTATETRLDVGAINVRLGEGRTAEVLRNLCYQIYEGPEGKKQWDELSTQVEELFGIQLEAPRYIPERGEITLAYQERGERKFRLDISSSGRGLQQTLLLLAYMMVNPNSVLLLDEPDAHLEILRQRQIYQILTEAAQRHGSQIIAASHSEVLLAEAADRDMVIAFVGRPHRIDDRGTQVLKSLRDIGFDQYYQAEETGWVLYVEGSTDLAVLRGFARLLNHPAKDVLERPFVKYVDNQPVRAQAHYYGLREAKGDLQGIGIFDRLPQEPPADPNLPLITWRKCEIENYLATRESVLGWTAEMAKREAQGPLFAQSWVATMEQTIKEIEDAIGTLGEPNPWGPDIKVTDRFLDRLFARFFEKLHLPNLMRKTDYHVLTQHLDPGAIDAEVTEKLDAIMLVASRASPRN